MNNIQFISAILTMLISIPVVALAVLLDAFIVDNFPKIIFNIRYYLTGVDFENSYVGIILIIILFFLALKEKEYSIKV